LVGTDLNDAARAALLAKRYHSLVFVFEGTWLLSGRNVDDRPGELVGIPCGVRGGSWFDPSGFARLEYIHLFERKQPCRWFEERSDRNQIFHYRQSIIGVRGHGPKLDTAIGQCDFNHRHWNVSICHPGNMHPRCPFSTPESRHNQTDSLPKFGGDARLPFQMGSFGINEGRESPELARSLFRPVLQGR